MQSLLAVADRRVREISFAAIFAVAALVPLGELAAAFAVTGALAALVLGICAYRGRRPADLSSEVEALNTTVNDLRFSNGLLGEALERARLLLRQEDVAAGLVSRKQLEVEWARNVARFERRGELFALVVARLETDGFAGEDGTAIEAADRHLGETLIFLTRGEDTVGRIAEHAYAALLASTRVEGGPRFAERIHFMLPSRPAAEDGREPFPGIVCGQAAWEHGIAIAR